MLNSVCLVGTITEAGVKLLYRDNGTPEAKWTMLLEESGKDAATFKLFCPVVAYGAKAEDFAARFDARDVISCSGKLAWQVEKILTPAMVTSAN